MFLVIKIRKTIKFFIHIHTTDLIDPEGKKHYFLIEDFITFVYDHTSHHRKKYFCHNCLQTLSTEEMLIVILKTALKLMANQWLYCLKKMSVKYRNCERKIKSPFIIYADFESILVPENNGT